MSYFILKLVHIMGASILFGTGLGIAFFMFLAVRSGDIRVIAPVSRIVVVADYIFTLTAAILQPVSGALLVFEVGYSFSDFWVYMSLILYVLIGLCWIPVVFMQIEMSRLANEVLLSGATLPARFHQLYRRWFVLGWPAFISILGIFTLMIMKPDHLF